MRHVFCLTMAVLFMVLCAGCEKADCGTGSGFAVPFCRQVDNYRGADPEKDSITVECIVGPIFGSVYGSRNGTYYCSGTYKLGSKDSAEISLNWGGSTRYSMYQEFKITAPGEGRFNVAVKKTRGGSGNLFLSMVSHSTIMLDVVPVNSDCDGTKTAELTESIESEAAWLVDSVQNANDIDVTYPYSYRVPWSASVPIGIFKVFAE